MTDIVEKQRWDNVTLSVLVDADALHPAGYVYENGKKIPILIGGKPYSWKGELIIKNKSLSSIHINQLGISIEGRMKMDVDEYHSKEIRIEEKNVSLNVADRVRKTATYPFTIENYIPKYDSYKGIAATIHHFFRIVVGLSDTEKYAIAIPFCVRFPMPLPSLKMGLTTTCKLLDMLVLRIHLDSTVFTVNDIVTGWIEVLKSERRMDSIYVSLIREELLHLDTCSVSREQLIKREVVDTIMKVDNYEKPVAKQIESKVRITSGVNNDLNDVSANHMPFRFFINEFMGVSPSYSLIQNTLSVKWVVLFTVYDQNQLEYTYSIPIDIIRGDIFDFN